MTLINNLTNKHNASLKTHGQYTWRNICVILGQIYQIPAHLLTHWVVDVEHFIKQSFRSCYVCCCQNFCIAPTPYWCKGVIGVWLSAFIFHSCLNLVWWSVLLLVELYNRFIVHPSTFCSVLSTYLHLVKIIVSCLMGQLWLSLCDIDPPRLQFSILKSNDKWSNHPEMMAF